MVCETLQKAGYDGYLVGGCVRDLILGVTPKDFDVTTNATPEQAHALFSRSRIIGRRFKLLHVRFGYRELIEVATYRGKPAAKKGGKIMSWFKSKTAPSGRILDDNVFGTIEQDAERRDFTINALYYDPVKEEVLDFVGGLQDAHDKQLRIIGDPAKRFSEDPVRMLRVIRFEAKLGVKVDAKVIKLVRDNAALLDDVPAARLFDEVLKLLHHAHASDSWRLLKDYGFLPRLFPNLTDSMIEPNSQSEQLIVRALENTDRRIAGGKSVTPSFLFSAILWPVFSVRLATLLDRKVRFNEAISQAGQSVFSEQVKRVAVPRRFSDPAIEMWGMQFKFERRRPKTIRGLLASRRFRAAYDLLLLRQKAGEVEQSLTDWWTKIQRVTEEEQVDMIGNLAPGNKPGTGRQRKPRRRRPAGQANSRKPSGPKPD